MHLKVSLNYVKTAAKNSFRRGACGLTASVLILVNLACSSPSPPASPTLQPPNSLTYSENPALFTKGVAISPLTPTSTGGAVTAYTVSPGIPAGLSLSGSTGIIVGTPSTVTPLATYTVTASNLAGSTTCALMLTVNDLPPIGLVYSPNPLLCTVGVLVPPCTPSAGGGAITSFTVNPALPPGLSLNASSGAISGTPVAVSPQANYTVTAGNSGGTASCELVISVASPIVVSLLPASAIVQSLEGIQFTAVVTGTSNTAVTWSVNDIVGGNSTIGTISPNGLFVAPQVVPNPSTVTVKATSAADTSKFGSAVVTIHAPTVSVTVMPTLASVQIGASRQFTAVVNGNSDTSVIWSVNDIVGGNSIVGTVSNSGLYTAPQAVPSPASVTVKARSIADGTRYANASVVIQAGAFSMTGSMTTPRFLHSGTLLPTGKVLIAGGGDENQELATAELYDPATGLFTSTGTMSRPRAGHTATLLPNGKVLIVGGGMTGDNALASAEVFDPTTGTFVTTGSMSVARVFHTATLLPSGQVLIIGGTSGAGKVFSAYASAEVYEPSTGTFTTVGSMNLARYLHSATLLSTGKVLIAGGSNTIDYSNSAELYNPLSSKFEATGSMVAARGTHTATLLPDGKVLLAGGGNKDGLTVKGELYDATKGSFITTGSLVAPGTLQTSTLLANGQVLLAGGVKNSEGLPMAEMYDPSSGTFTSTGSMSSGRGWHSANSLPNGLYLITGGVSFDPEIVYSSAELFNLGDVVIGLPQGVSTGITDAMGRVQIILSGNLYRIQFLDAFNWPIAGLLVGAKLSPEISSMGVFLAVDPQESRRPIMGFLHSYMAQSISQISEKDSTSQNDVSEIIIKSGSWLNDLVGIYGIPTSFVTKEVLGAFGAFSILVDTARVLNGIPGQPIIHSLQELSMGEITTISREEAIQEITVSNQINNWESTIILGAALTANAPVFFDIAGGVVMSKVGTIFDKTTVIGCTGDVLRLKYGTLVLYGCKDVYDPRTFFNGSPYIDLSAPGGGLVKIINKDTAGIGISAVLDSNGNARIPVPMGRWDFQVEGPAIDPAVLSDVHVPAGGGPINIPSGGSLQVYKGTAIITSISTGQNAENCSPSTYVVTSTTSTLPAELNVNKSLLSAGEFFGILTMGAGTETVQTPTVTCINPDGSSTTVPGYSSTQSFGGSEFGLKGISNGTAITFNFANPLYCNSGGTGILAVEPVTGIVHIGMKYTSTCNDSGVTVEVSLNVSLSKN